MARPRAFYRGDQRSNWGLTLFVTVLAALVLLLAFLFYHLQEYAVYEKDGLRLVLPGEEDAADTRGAAVSGRRELAALSDVEIVVDKTDYSAVTTSAGTNVPVIRARAVAANAMNSFTLDSLVAGSKDYDALLLEVKPTTGALTYASRIPLTNSYGVNGTLDLKSYVEKFKDDGIYLVAEMSCLADSSMAVRNSALALKSSLTGGIYTSDGMAWLDPYNDATRAYLTALIDELRDMGFDEVLLSGLYCPNSGELQFSAQMTVTPDTESAVSSLSLHLRERAEADGIRLSALAETVTLRSGSGAAIGQDLPVFFRIFDRVAFEADPYNYDADMSMLQAALGEPSEPRFLPVCSGFTPQRSCYALRA